MKEKILGLSSEEVLKSREKYGSNTLLKKKTKGLLYRLWENLSDPIIRILLLATALRVLFSFGDCNWFEIGGILLAVFVAASVTTLSEWGNEKTFEKMSAGNSEKRITVLRDGIPENVCEGDLVVGDIVYLHAGEEIPADGIVLEGSFTVDQSALNGESAEAFKSAKGKTESAWDLENTKQVYRGSVAMEGNGIMRVCRVGSQTYYGAVAIGVQEETRESPLKVRLRRLASQISHIGYLMAALVALTNLFFTFIVSNGFSPAYILADLKNTPYLLSSLLHAFSIMITVVVVAVPEGLPMMITVLLSSNMRRMQKDGVMVKKMVGIETAGSLNILYTDKTGTLTTGQMSVDSFFTEHNTYKSLHALKKEQNLYFLLSLIAKYNTETVICGKTVHGGNQTDRAIAAFFSGEKESAADVIERVPFDSNKKYATATVRFVGRDIELIKGAPEIIIGMCDRVFEDKERRKLSARDALYSRYAQEAKSGKRILGFAYKEKSQSGYTFLCFAALKDKLRTGTKQAVEEVQRAGVQVVMITGDGEETATHVATECGIIKKKSTDAVISGEALRNMSDEALLSLIPSLRVIYRALPDDKMRLVSASQKLGLVVGMTGDGINDAPALKNADIGFSMGSGTDIAKSASDIVLLNDHFSAIGKTVLYGRTIFHSIQKFVTFQLIMNLAACGVSFLGQFIGIETPITIVQMLWVNLIMDTLGGLAFAGEPPMQYYMLEKPKTRTAPILTRDMIKKVFIIGGFTLSVCMLYLKGALLNERFDASPDNKEFLTGFYALFIFIGLFNCLHTRSDRFWPFHGVFENKPFILILSFISVIQILIIYRGGALFRSVPLSIGQFSAIISLSFSVIPFDFLRRCFVKLKPLSDAS